MRILDSSPAKLDIDKLGFNDIQKKEYLDALHRSQGLILVTGPTGSGKTVSCIPASDFSMMTRPISPPPRTLLKSTFME